MNKDSMEEKQPKGIKINMRIIKFRMWDGFQMSEYHLEIDGSGSLALPPKPYPVGLPTERPFIVIMQFTGLLDKDGKEIYEGDIVLSNEGTKHEVKWGTEDDDYPAFDLYPSLGSDGECNSFSLISQSAEGYEIEIIGNIYETPLTG